jgi:16S rRNA (uracil1498-N3)-methyltransferase
MRRRFFIEQFDGASAVMEGEAAHHLGRVLRAQTGQLYELSDGARVQLGRVENVTRDRVEFALVEEIPSWQPAVQTMLLLALVKFDSFEWALEKATELGVATIVPVAAARSEKALVAAAGKRSERWRRLLLEASQQSRRVRLPRLAETARPSEVFGGSKGSAKILLSERTSASPLRDILENLQTAQAAVVAIGPEGGWTDQEFAAAMEAGFAEASLGRLILRTETAVVTTLACVKYALEK